VAAENRDEGLSVRKLLMYLAVLGSLLGHGAYVLSDDRGSGGSSYRSYGGGSSGWGGFSGGHK
jgi:hypothetical protein